MKTVYSGPHFFSLLLMMTLCVALQFDPGFDDIIHGYQYIIFVLFSDPTAASCLNRLLICTKRRIMSRNKRKKTRSLTLSLTLGKTCATPIVAPNFSQFYNKFYILCFQMPEFGINVECGPVLGVLV